jgi:hypothetical protein
MTEMNMFAGRSKHEIGTRVRITGITDPNDADLNGEEGTLRHPYRKFPEQDVGIRLDNGTNVSLRLGEYEVIQ